MCVCVCVYTQVDPLIESLTAEEHIVLFASIKGVEERRVQQQTQELLVRDTHTHTHTHTHTYTETLNLPRACEGAHARSAIEMQIRL